MTTTTTETEPTLAPELCQRCGVDTEGDGRTLWHACFYEMGELGLPFKRDRLFDVDLAECELAKPATTFDPKLPGVAPLVIGSPTLRCSGELTPMALYTLRVCKRCRSSWLGAIKEWFEGGPPEGRPSPGTGIWVRRYGTNVEVTEEEWRAMAGDREPVRFRGDGAE